MSKFLLMTEYAEITDLAMRLKDEGHEVLMNIREHDYEHIGDGIIEKDHSWWQCLGKDYVFIFDGCENGNLQDWLRSKGEAVFGGTEYADKLENERELGNKLFKKAGFMQPESKNFKDFPSAIKHVKGSDKRWIMKQEGNAPKSLNHMGKFEDGSDMLLHLEEMSKKWNISEFGPVNFVLMEVVEGLEVAASAFFNGTDWMRDKDGKVTGYINWEDKKETDGNTGETTGEMGTTFMGVNEDNKLFKDILLKPEITRVLKDMGYRGVFDINCIKTKEGIVALEPTCRLGVPSTSYELIEGLDMDAGTLIEAVAKGKDTPISIHKGLGMVMVVAAKPYPTDAKLEAKDTSLGEKLWILKDGKPTDDMDAEQKKHIHLQNFEKTDDGYRVATFNGYLLTVTSREGKTIADIREHLIEYIKSNLYISGMKYRSDIGARVEEYYGTDKRSAIEKQHADELAKRDKDMEDIKSALKKAIYEEEK